MSTIKTGTTLTTSYQVVGDTTGALVIQTGATPTTAVTIGADQSTTLAGTLSVTGNTAMTGYLNVPNTFGFKNRIINGSMAIAQRTTSAAATDGGYPSIDRYQTFTQTGEGAFTVAQVTDAPTGFPYSAKLTVTTADASITAGQRYLFLQNIEGTNIVDLAFGTASASPVAISFWAKSSLTGVFGGCLINHSFSRSYPFNYTINSANTWEYKTVLITGSTAGDWLTSTSVGMRVVFSLGAGSGAVGPANTWADTGYWQPTGSVNLISTVNATMQITGLQLEKGAVATSYDFRPTYPTEFTLCQRYYQKVGSCYAGTVISNELSIAFAYSMWVPMRANPASDGFAGNFHRPGIAFYAVNSITQVQDANGSGYSGGTISAGAGAGTQGQLNGLLSLKAEL